MITDKYLKKFNKILVPVICFFLLWLCACTNEQEYQKTISPVAEIPKKEPSRAEIVISDMTLSDMIYQMMFLPPETISGEGRVTGFTDSLKEGLNKYPVGGIVYFSPNFTNREATVQMIAETKAACKIAPFVGVDEEGGVVSRLGDNPNMGVTRHPNMQSIGNTGDPKRAYAVGETLGKELTAVGFNMDFAPNADVLVNMNNTEIGSRSFGSDPYLVGSMVQNAVKGMQDNNLSATLKHFPGHGSTHADSHMGYSESGRTLEELRSCEFIPFKEGIEADFVMVSHMTLISATEEKVPSSVSKEVITDWLKGELGYKGIVITDSFIMGAITSKYTPGEAAVKAIKAGADMILITPDPKASHDAIMAAVQSGEITEERIKESVLKIIELKIKRGII